MGTHQPPLPNMPENANTSLARGVLQKTILAYQLVFTLTFFAILLTPLRRLTFSPNELEENFYGRAWLIQAFNNTRLAIGDRVFPKVIVGNEGWIFYRAEKTMDEYQHTIIFSDEELARIQMNLDAINDRYAARGIQLVILIAPDKTTIYGDYMPAEIPVIGKQSRLDQLIVYLNTHGQTQLLDLRSQLRAARQNQQVYYKTDTHWNDFGAYVVYTEIMKVLQTQHPNLQAHLLDMFKVKSQGLKLMDLSRNIGANLWLEEKFDLAPTYSEGERYRDLPLDGGRSLTMTYNEDQSLPRAVIYHDSFFFQLIPMLSPHFSQVTYIAHYTGREIWNLAWVDEEQPNIVIVEFAERYIADIPLLLKP